jgi:hypothetical protein
MPEQSPSELLTKLAQRTKDAEEAAAAARARNREALEARRKAIEASIRESEAKLAAAEEDAQSKWGQMAKTLHNNFAEKRRQIKANLDDQKASRDAKRAVRRADEAESDAALAVALAADALETAEYEVIDAALARAEADELTTA